MNENDNELIKLRILEYSYKTNINISELAKKADLKQSTLNNIINRETIPTIKTVKKIADGFDVSTVEFLNFEPYNEKPDESEKHTPENKIDTMIEELTKLKNQIKNEKNSTTNTE